MKLSDAVPRAAFRPARFQRGTGLFVWICILFTVVVAGALSYKLIPLYVEHASVKQVLEKFAGETETPGMSIGNARKAVSARFTSSRVDAITEKDVVFERIPKGMRINGNYSKRVPFFSNIELVVTFDDLSFEATRN